MAASYVRFSLALLAAIPFVDHLCGNDADQPFAAVLQRLIRASRENFRPVEGARIELHPGNESYFQPKVVLPGATECRIDEQPPVYSCKWKPLRPDSPESARCEKLVAEIEAALGSDWSRAGSTKPESKTKFNNRGRYRMTEVTVTAPAGNTPVCTIAISVLKAVEHTAP